MRAGDKDRDLSHRWRKQWLRSDRLHQFPNRLAEFRLMDPGIPRAEQRAVVADADKTLKARGDALLHVLVKRLLFRIQFGWGNDRQAHDEFLRQDKSSRQTRGAFAVQLSDSPDAMANELRVTPKLGAHHRLPIF